MKMAEVNSGSPLAENGNIATSDASLACPLCHSGDQKIISQHENRFLFRCPHCGVSFIYPQPTLSSVSTHFQDSSTLDEAEERNRFERNRERVLSRIANYIGTQRRTGRILDVGCATGFFLNRFFSEPSWQRWGVELSSSRAEKATKIGVTVHNGTIRDAEYPQNFFDVITILDAFYYFPQPQTDLGKLRHVLGPEGMLVIELPFAKSRIWRTSGKLGRLLSGTRLPLLRTSDHLFFYNPKSLSSLLCSCGFRVRTIEQLPANRQERPLRNLIYGCYSLFSFFLSRMSGSRIILGPRFFIVAQKV